MTGVKEKVGKVVNRTAYALIKVLSIGLYFRFCLNHAYMARLI